LPPDPPVEAVQVHPLLEVAPELRRSQGRRHLSRLVLDVVDDGLPEGLPPGDFARVAHVAEFLHVAVVPAQHPEGEAAVRAPAGQAQGVDVLADVVDGLAPFAVEAEDAAELLQRARHGLLAQSGEQTANDRQHHRAREGGIGHPEARPDLLAQDGGHLGRADAAVAGDMDGRPDGARGGEGGEHGRGHAIDGDEVELCGRVGGKGQSHHADQAGAHPLRPSRREGLERAQHAAERVHGRVDHLGVAAVVAGMAVAHDDRRQELDHAQAVLDHGPLRLPRGQGLGQLVVVVVVVPREGRLALPRPPGAGAPVNVGGLHRDVGDEGRALRPLGLQREGGGMACAHDVGAVRLLEGRVERYRGCAVDDVRHLREEAIPLGGRQAQSRLLDVSPHEAELVREAAAESQLAKEDETSLLRAEDARAARAPVPLP
jgi:hypothetical protein